MHCAPSALSPNALTTIMANQDDVEQLLRSTLEKLDRERTRRMQLEEEVKALQASCTESQEEPSPPSTPSKNPRYSSSSPQQCTSILAATALENELDEYRQIVNAIFHEKPAIAAAMRVSEQRRLAVRIGRSAPVPIQNSLPVHVIQLLEVMPWDPKVQEYAVGTEEIYEWQVYYEDENVWSVDMQLFPAFFGALPLIATQVSQATGATTPANARIAFLNGKNKSKIVTNQLSSELCGGSSFLVAPPDPSILTNSDLSRRLASSEAVSLPQDNGTWAWAGNWRIDKRVIVSYAGKNETGDAQFTQRERRQTSLDSDDDGWSYAHSAGDFVKDRPDQYCHDHPGSIQNKITLEKAAIMGGSELVRHFIPRRKVRRRKWVRRRVLLDYPLASERSKQFLQLLYQNTALTESAMAASDQLVETKLLMSSQQLSSHQHGEETRRKVARLKRDMQIKEKYIQKLQQKRVAELKKMLAASNPKANPELKRTAPCAEQSQASIGTRAEEGTTSDDGKTPASGPVNKPVFGTRDIFPCLILQWASSRRPRDLSSDNDEDHGSSSEAESTIADDDVDSSFSDSDSVSVGADARTKAL